MMILNNKYILNAKIYLNKLKHNLYYYKYSNMKRSPRINYTLDMIIETMNKYESKLVNEYSNISGQTKITFICNCGLMNEKKCKDIIHYGATCKTCGKKYSKERRKQTSVLRYGVESVLQLKEIQDKIKQTNIQKYGVESNLAAESTKQKIKETFLKKYGVTNPNQNPEIIEKTKQTNIIKYGVSNPNKLEEIKQKTKQTNITKYGVECILQKETICKKRKNTSLIKYGVEYAITSKEVQEKRVETNLEKYGGKSPLQNQEIQKKSKKTMMEKYGVEHALQSEELFTKQQMNAYSLKEYTMPSGIVRKVQGFEIFALNELIKLYSENQIQTGKGNVPRIKYQIQNNTHYYFPDIFIPHENKIIEVKSIWTYEKDKEKNKLKEIACVDNGYNFELWIYDKNGKKIESFN
jgi:hypothetical protein